MKEQLALIKRTVQILDSISYENYSAGSAHNYLQYIAGQRADEITLIEGVLFPIFAEQILGFQLGKSFWRQDQQDMLHGRPDFIPVDNNSHSFVFDIKGTDTARLPKHYEEKKKYIAQNDITFLVLTNMRDLDVYTEESGNPVESYSFSFVQLYKDYKDGHGSVIDKRNTKRFFTFLERFAFRKLTLDDKINRIAQAKPSKLFERLDPDLLTERLRAIVSVLYEDITSSSTNLYQLLESNPDKAANICEEIALMASQISSNNKTENATPELFEKILRSSQTTLYGQSLHSFFYRVAYFTMTRLLLARTWEDIGFIDQSLYDGGFKKWYDNFNHEIGRVLKNAFGFAAERYPWLFEVDNNYSWYKPSDKALIESLYELSNFSLAGIDQDVLGAIYEEYIDKTDKKNKGQYYTPRQIVSFIWDRVGYTGPKAFFWQFEGKRVPRFVFDPATGSGGFLVEAARRLRETLSVDCSDFQSLFEVYRGILHYLFGAEISVFPYYITEVNLLIQLTPILKRMMELKRSFREESPMGVVRVDALSLYDPKEFLFNENPDTILQGDTANILPLDGPKRAVFHKIREKFDGKFSYCCANPPYVGEKGHKELFRETLRRFPLWRQYYHGKMDYLYWFVILGLSKLRNWGKLSFITTHYWLAAAGSQKLKQYILRNALVKELIFFGAVKIFEHAKGQHNMIFVLQKVNDSASTTDNRSPQEVRDANRIKIVKVTCTNKDLPGKTIGKNLAFLTQHISKHIGKSVYEDKYMRVFWSGRPQKDLTATKPWNLTYDVSVHRILSKLQQKGEPLGERLCDVNQGLVSGAPTVSKKNIALLTQETVSRYGIKDGDGIFVLSPEELQSLGLKEDERALIKPYYKSTAIKKYFANETIAKHLLYLTKDTKIDQYPNIKSHIEKFRPILEAKRECRQGKLPWYSLHWARRKSIFENEKLVSPNFARQNTFAYVAVAFYAEFDTYFITKKDVSESLQYLSAILNSTLMNFWMAHRSKRKGDKGDVRVYNTDYISSVPIRRIDFHNPQQAGLHDEIVQKVRIISQTVRDLSDCAKYFKNVRSTEFVSSVSVPETNDGVIIRGLPPDKLYSLRTHPNIKIHKPKGMQPADFHLHKVGRPSLVLDGTNELQLMGKSNLGLRMAGSYQLLSLVAKLLEDWKGKSWETILNQFLVPENPEAYESRKTAIANKCRDLFCQVAEAQDNIDSIVYHLYGLREAEVKAVKSFVMC